MLQEAGIPEGAARQQAVAAAQRLYLVRAFEEPDKVIARVTQKVVAIVATFPRTPADIERRNAGPGRIPGSDPLGGHRRKS